MNKPKRWTIKQIWDDAFENMQQEPIKLREYLYASELGSSYIDCYYKLKGIPFTNLPTSAARKKMEAGKIFESVILFVLKRAGILKNAQTKIDFALPGCVEVHGKLDFLAGGEIDIKQAEEFTALIKILFEELQMPKVYLSIADSVIRMIQEAKESEAHTLYEYVLECKSVSNYVWDLIEANREPNPYHKLQIFHYLHGLQKEEGKVIYINRDDVRIMELPVYNNSDNFSHYLKWIEKFTDHWQSKKSPEKEPLIIFNKNTLKFYKNTMGVEWSRYLSLLYGFDSPMSYREYVTPIIKNINYAYQRCISGKKITDGNQESILIAKKFFPDFDYLVDVGKLTRICESEQIIEN